MRVKFLKGIVSIFGTFEPGMVTDVPVEKIAESWCRNGIAVEVPSGKKPAIVAEDLFWCKKHERLHKLTSAVGKKCLKRIEVEKETEESEEEEESEESDEN